MYPPFQNSPFLECTALVFMGIDFFLQPGELYSPMVYFAEVRTDSSEWPCSVMVLLIVINAQKSYIYVVQWHPQMLQHMQVCKESAILIQFTDL